MPDPVRRLNLVLEGRYHIERELGEGGMAMVFLADDLRHERKVALKVLKPELAAAIGADRFLAEIKTTANLRHPHILPLFDSGEAEGFLFYVMPYVEGETLRQTLEREGELPVHTTVRILRDIVDALAHAHSHDVVHRDVKPGNIMISGRHASVMDFGVAKAIGGLPEDDDGDTTVGVALGTPTYMAPEQAAADPHVDHRADIYAAGVVAYELLTGSPPFSGRGSREILSAHVTQSPEPLRQRRESVPPRLESAVMRCLEKRAADRWQSADELLDVLEEALTPSEGATPVATPPSTATAPPSKRLAALAGVAVTLLVGFALWNVATGDGSGVAPLSISDTRRLTSDPGLEIHPAISPDGRFVVYAAGTAARMRLFLRSVDGSRTIALTEDSTASEHQPRWSPDGTRLLFLSEGHAMSAPALGGSATPLARGGEGDPIVAAAWSPRGDEVAVVRGNDVVVEPIGGGEGRVVASTPSLRSCDWSPVAELLTCVRGNPVYLTPGVLFGNLAPSALVSIDLDDGTIIDLLPATAMNQAPIWSADGRAIYFVSDRQGSPDIFVLRLDAQGQPLGEPERITTGSGVHSFSLTQDGSGLAYSVYTAQANIWTVPVPAMPPVGIGDAVQLTFGVQLIEAVHPSRDGAWLLYDSNVSGSSDIWRIPGAGGSPQQLTDEPMPEFAPDLSPDGSEVAYHGFVGGSREIFVRSLETGVVTQVTDGPRAHESYPAWSPDGMTIAFHDQATDGSGGAYLVHRGPAGTWGPPEQLLSTEGGPGRARWSSDGSQIAYVDMSSSLSAIDVETGGSLSVIDPSTREVRVLHRPRPGEQLGEPHWSADDTEVYFKSIDSEGRAAIWAIRFDAGEPRLLVRFDDPALLSLRPDLGGDGTAFYFTLQDRQSDIWVAETETR